MPDLQQLLWLPVTKELEIMVAIRLTYHNSSLLAKAVANLAYISNDRISLNVVASRWKAEADKYGIGFFSIESSLKILVTTRESLIILPQNS